MREAIKHWWAAAFSLVGGLLGAGLIYLASRPPAGEPIRLLPPPTPAPLVVQVAGSVTRPGVYRLPAGSRVEDALQAAGGSLDTGNSQALNLAATLVDGGRVYVPSLLTATALSGAASTPEAPPGRAAPLVSNQLINLNQATQAELESLPGIGPALAGRIITYRQDHGAFAQVEDIQKVTGIGPAIFNQIKDLITVEGAP